MFVYLTKKIALANQKKIYCLSWSHQFGYIACGGDGGLLKVLKLDDQQMANHKKEHGAAAKPPKFLSVNQTLEGHQDSVIHLQWNDHYEKLISSDINGLVIVWMCFKGNYYEKMVNNRNRSVVIEVKWTYHGDKIVIVYEDGTVIVGSVEGHRLWTKEISKTIKLTCAEWSPDSKVLLFGLANGQVHCYDSQGNFFAKVTLFLKVANQVQNLSENSKFNYNPPQSQISVVSMNWYPRRTGGISCSLPKPVPSKDLAIAFSNGEIHLLANENDDDSIIIRSDQINLTAIRQIEWCPQGTVLAVCGFLVDPINGKIDNFVKFIDKTGSVNYSLHVPGNGELVCCAWDLTGFKIALGVDNYILFANVRPDLKRKLAYFADTFTFFLPNQEQLLVFYQLKSSKMTTKLIPELLGISSKGQYCCLGTSLLSAEDGSEMKSTLLLCNSLGTTVDTINIDFKIKCLTMSSTRVIAASNDSFCIWLFKTPTSMNTKTAGEEFENYDKLFNVYLSRTETIINCCCCSDKILVIGQESSVFLVYTLPRASLAFKLNLPNSSAVPKHISLNMNSDRLAVLSTTGVLNLFQLELNGGRLLEFARKDIWDFRWSEDSNNFIAFNEKSKLLMYTFKDQFTAEDKEETAGTSYGYLCEVKNMVAKALNFDALNLDLIEKSLDYFHLGNYIELFESDLLKRVKILFEKGDLVELSKFIEQNSHQTLWSLLADCALRASNYEIAELALVKCKNFQGIQFLKRLKKLNDKNLQQAEVCLYLKEFDRAKQIYQQTGRLDLEINMRKLFGDWESLLELVKNELGADQTFLSTVYDELGQFYMEQQECWKAVDCFRQSGNQESLKNCLIRLERYDEIRKLASNPDLKDLKLARYLESIGLCEQAVAIYLNCDQKEAAIDCAIQLNEWQKAIELAQEHSLRNVGDLLESYAEHLAKKQQDFAIVELYRKARHYSRALNYLLSLADKLKSEPENCGDPAKMKKMYATVGVLYEEKCDYEKALEEQQQRSANKEHPAAGKRNRLSALLENNNENNNTLRLSNQGAPLLTSDVWRGAEAYHFYMLAQRQLFDGYTDASMKTALLLIDYEQFIGAAQIYSLIALTSALNRNFSICSKAFIKLELLDDEDEAYKKLACQIFSKYPPKLPANLNKIECPFCESLSYDFQTNCSNCETRFRVCIASGTRILNMNDIWTCRCCKHSAIKSDLVAYHNCPLCHFPL